LQELAEQAASRAHGLQQAGEGLRLSVDQEHQFKEIAGLRGELEKLKMKNAQEVNLLQKKLESLKGEKSSLEEKNKAL
jgi:predicted nuclease with TOPRIM domain